MNNDKYMPLLDVDNDLNIFMTYIPNHCGYAAIIYDYNQTDDYGEGEQAIQSRFYDYMSLDAKPITDYIKGPFFIGVDKDPSIALARATEQCNAYYRAIKEGIGVKIVNGQTEYVFPVSINDLSNCMAMPVEDDPKRVSISARHGPRTSVDGAIYIYILLS